MKMNTMKSSLLAFFLVMGVLNSQAQSNGTSQEFVYTGNFEYYTVPVTGWYLLDGSGAEGGRNFNLSKVGGKGARVQTRVKLQAGDLLKIAVGGMGKEPKVSDSSGGGGGGASAVVRINGTEMEPLLFAGGGGGASAILDGGSGRINYDLIAKNSSSDYWRNGGPAGGGGGFTRDGMDMRESYREAGNSYGGPSDPQYVYFTGDSIAGGKAFINGFTGGMSNRSRGGYGGWGGGGQGGRGVFIQKHSMKTQAFDEDNNSLIRGYFDFFDNFIYLVGDTSTIGAGVKPIYEQLPIENQSILMPGGGVTTTTMNNGAGGGGGGFFGGDSGEQDSVTNSSTLLKFDLANPAKGGISYIAQGSNPLGLEQLENANSGNGKLSISLIQEPLPAATYFFSSERFWNYIVPRSGWYLLDVNGAMGGPSVWHWNSSFNEKIEAEGGPGARVKAYAKLDAGDTLRIGAGGKGKKFSIIYSSKLDLDVNFLVGASTGGGGGGASSVVRVKGGTFQPLVIAAGGGGGSGYFYEDKGTGRRSPGGKGLGANTTASGGIGGATRADKKDGGGGGGFYTDGVTNRFDNFNTASMPEWGVGGKSYLNGFKGGYDANWNLGGYGGKGGFGGGGQGSVPFATSNKSPDVPGGGGGGGGGYLGGAGGNDGNGGNGGGSYWDPNLIPADATITDGGSLGMGGLVFISFVPDYQEAVISTDEANFSYAGQLFQYYKAPQDGWYFINAFGAQGGESGELKKVGGLGASMQGHFFLKKGELLRIGVGEKGEKSTGVTGGGGGGGASSVVKVNEDSTYQPIVIAGGGGGAGINQEGSHGLKDGNLGVGGLTGYNTKALQGLIEGSNLDPFYGAGGGGWESSGYGVPFEYEKFNQEDQNMLLQNFIGPGANYREGHFGGFALRQPDGECCTGSRGGWGGGGAGHGKGGGGGGGGSTGGYGVQSLNGGGGGGSYIRTDSLSVAVASESGVKSGNGEVIIRYMPNLIKDDVFGVTGKFEIYTVPKTGWYLLEAAGAQGGSTMNKENYINGQGGKGARMQGYVKLNAGDKLKIGVGEMGKMDKDYSINQYNNRTGGGGGATSIVLYKSPAPDEPLLFAGGGGGAAFKSDGLPGVVSVNGTPQSSTDVEGTEDGVSTKIKNNVGLGGINGQGGNSAPGASTQMKGAGGGGFLSAGKGGLTEIPFNSIKQNWEVMFGGPSHREGYKTIFGPLYVFDNEEFRNNYAAPGGWGGGGDGTPGDVANTRDGKPNPYYLEWKGIWSNGGGGGGGYSGGGGGTNFYGGGGGGSYLDKRLLLANTKQLSGENTGNGWAKVKYVPDFNPDESEFKYQGSRFQYYVVPTTGNYLLDASGAQGGFVLTKKGGKGARMQGYASLTKGDSLQIAVGGQGGEGLVQYDLPNGGGGGGGSSIVKIKNGKVEPLLFAGGGGGASEAADGGPGQAGINGQSFFDIRSESQGAPSNASTISGGFDGGGGGAYNDKTSGAGGGGFKNDGVSSSVEKNGKVSITSYAGQAYLSGNNGGSIGPEYGWEVKNFDKDYARGPGGEGGWGGGGQGGRASNGFLFFADTRGGGAGGGGYSGGGGGGGNSGGGGSFIAKTMDTHGCLAETGVHSGNGVVSIKLVSEYPTGKTVAYQFKGNVFQIYVVPETGLYSLKAWGAGGGQNSDGTMLGGNGAIAQGYMTLQKGDNLRIAVGGAGGIGINPAGNYTSGGGGGGGTSIVRSTVSGYELLLLAGGGGGGHYAGQGSHSTKYTFGSLTSSGGSIRDNKYGGAGGAGYLVDGGTHYSEGLFNNSVLSYGGQAYVSGNFGGFIANGGGSGGWGGGGQGGPAKDALILGTDGGGGGGGGYSGGDGGEVTVKQSGAGTSYFSTLIDSTNFQFTPGANSGDGLFSIRLVQSNIFLSQEEKFQTYTVPTSGFYELEAKGAQGGTSGSKLGGKGAKINGVFYLKAGESLKIAVGGKGGNGSGTGYFLSGGGGGGASSIVKVSSTLSEPLVIAGGGGGASQDTVGGPGLITNDGGSSRSVVGGSASLGGKVYFQFYPGGAGGAGNFGSGATTRLTSNANSLVWAAGGQSYLFGNKGGTSISDGGYGGWGGGGQGGPVIPAKYGLGGGSGGGGGGYSGGSSSYSTMVTAPKEMLPRVAASGGGGGSYVSPKSFAVGLSKTAGFNEGNGSVRIYGPRTLVETVRTTLKTYTWIRNKVSYSSNGVYEYVDSSTATTYTLNLTLFNLVQGPGPSPASPGGSLMAFPNPSDGKMKLRLPRAEQQTILEILSMDGRLIKEYKIAPFTTAMELDLRHLGSGVYIFRLRGEGNDEWFRAEAIWLRTQQIKVVIQ